MPELPEVETIRLTLIPLLTERTITGGEVTFAKLLVDQTPQTFFSQITGQKIIDLTRRGKYLLINLSNSLVIAIHLRMTGQLAVLPHDSPLENATYLRIKLDNDQELRFRDQRKFGKVMVFLADHFPVAITKLGPEPLSQEFTSEVLEQRLARRKLAIKKALLNQDILAGLGNIYTDEALFLAGIHPVRMVDSLTKSEIQSLWRAIQQVLADGIEHRGTTKRDYRDGSGKSGSHQDHLLVYGRKGLPCPKCQGMIVKMNFGGRGTHFCPICQS